MNYEKKYREAIERAKEKYAMFKGMRQGDVLEDVFPELKESEDERIRKALVELVHDTTGDSLWVDYDVHKEDAIAYLEKQGEQKPADTGKGANGNEREIPNSAWSEDDETTRNNISHIIRQYDKISKRENKPCWYIGDCLLWMQNIKGRVLPQPKQEWSEEDKKLWVHDDDIFLDAAKMIVEESPRKSYGGVHKKEIVPWFYSLKERLKSLRSQNTWKPSDEQMNNK